MGLARAAVVEEREVGRGSGTLDGNPPVEDTTRLPGRPKAPPSLARSVGVARPGVVAFP